MSRILICDDHPFITRLLQLTLTKAGFAVESCPDGLAAWQAAQREVPLLMISDCQMPRMDGLGLLKCIRSDERTSEIPFILLSAKGFELSEMKLRQDWRIAALVSKPFSPREILHLVTRLVPGAAKHAEAKNKGVLSAR